MKILIINSAKGGVGKTYCAINLAKNLKGNVAIADMDITTPNVKEIEGVRTFTFESKKIPTKAGVKRFVSKIHKELEKDGCDWLIIDTPPTMSDTYVVISEAFVGARYLFVSTGGEDSINDTRAGITFFSTRGGIAIGVIQNMLCPQIGLAFDSEKRLGLTTLAEIKLSNSTPKLAFKDLAKKLEKIDITSGTIVKQEARIFPTVEESDLRRLNPNDLKFYNYETWDYVRERIVKMDTTAINFLSNPDTFDTPMNSHFDIDVSRIEEAFDQDESCNVVISKSLGIEKCPAIGSIVEVQVTTSNKISKGLPMFLTREGVYLWLDEANIISDKRVQETLDNGGVECGDGLIRFNFFETLYLNRAMNAHRDHPIHAREFNELKRWIEETKQDLDKKDIAFGLYTLEQDGKTDYDNFILDDYREYITENNSNYRGNYLEHFDKCVALGV